MPVTACPSCFYTRHWKIRREARKCKRCRKEFRVGSVYPVSSIRSTKNEWKKCIHVFLRQRAIAAVCEETGIPHGRIEKMLTVLRICMTNDVPDVFSGICEADETFIGGQRKNKRLHIRSQKGKRGHGTDKLPIVGVLHRDSGTVRAAIVVKRSQATVIGFIASCISGTATLYTDGYKMNRSITTYKPSVTHEYVNHHKGEYVRGTIHTNGIEGFWGYLKRHLATIGGIRPHRFPLFLGEITWRFNHRTQTKQEQAVLLLALVLTYDI